MSDGGERYSGVAVDRVGAVLRVQIDSPPLNLLTQAMRLSMAEVFASVAEDDGVRAVVFASGPKHFCAGADMSEFPQRFDPPTARVHGLNGHRMVLGMIGCGKPIVAGIEGACMGGGMEMALSCDVRIASRAAKVGLPEINRGVWPGIGGMALAARAIGDHKAKQLVMAGAILPAEEAAAMGLVDEVCEAGEAVDAAMARAEFLAAQPGQSVRTIKNLLDREFLERFKTHLAAELEAFVACYQTDDAKEGNKAFFEKRDPVWTHK
jgi:enoyl-CoA hydratase